MPMESHTHTHRPCEYIFYMHQHEREVLWRHFVLRRSCLLTCSRASALVSLGWGVCSQISSLVSLDFWSLVAFDMPLLSPTAFRSIPALLLSGSTGWFVARGPFRSRRATPLQSPESHITFVDDHKGQRKDGEDHFYHLLGFSEWTMVHLMWLSVQMKQDEDFNEPPAEEQAHLETFCVPPSADYTCVTWQYQYHPLTRMLLNVMRK